MVIHVATAGESIDVAYVDGVSITLGDPRKHVWTYVMLYCSATAVSLIMIVIYIVLVLLAEDLNHLHFVSDRYYCESGNVGAVIQMHITLQIRCGTD